MTMHLVKRDLLSLSIRIGRALRATEDGPIPYPEAIELLSGLEDELMELANRLTESETVPLTLICAWCSTVLRDGALPATHGICPTCQARVFTDLEGRKAS